MAAPTGTVQTFAQIGIREQLSDAIINIAPTDTPFTSMIKKGTCKSRNPEWLRDTLAAPNPVNKQIEGNDVTGNTMIQPERLRNYVQLFDKTVIVSDTARAVDTAGRNDELKYQIAKSGKEIKRDMEMRACGNYASATGNGTTAGEMAGFEAWLTTNVSRGASGASGGYNSGTGLTSIATDGTARAFTETLLKGVIKTCWEAGGSPDVVMMSGAKKQTASTFPGIAQQTNDVSDAKKITLQGAADLYRSDFGTHKLLANRFVGAAASRTPTNGLYPGQSALIVDPSTWEMKFLQPFGIQELGRTGHGERRLLKAEVTLCCKDERANAIVADLS